MLMELVNPPLERSTAMTEMEELEYRVQNLAKGDFSKFREWFYHFENDLWDEQIRADFKAGKFDPLIEKARAEFSQGKVREL